MSEDFMVFMLSRGEVELAVAQIQGMTGPDDEPPCLLDTLVEVLDRDVAEDEGSPWLTVAQMLALGEHIRGTYGSEPPAIEQEA